jgi:hypothetical protein
VIGPTIDEYGDMKSLTRNFAGAPAQAGPRIDLPLVVPCKQESVRVHPGRAVRAALGGGDAHRW